ncbi:MAG: hypothetical protein AAF662_03925 [Pseudomonadota bacterium]
MKNRTKIAIGFVAANSVLMLMGLWGFLGVIAFMNIMGTEANVFGALIIVRDLCFKDKAGAQVAMTRTAAEKF